MDTVSVVGQTAIASDAKIGQIGHRASRWASKFGARQCTPLCTATTTISSISLVITASGENLFQILFRLCFSRFELVQLQQQLVKEIVGEKEKKVPYLSNHLATSFVSFTMICFLLQLLLNSFPGGTILQRKFTNNLQQ